MSSHDFNARSRTKSPPPRNAIVSFAAAIAGVFAPAVSAPATAPVLSRE
jgi:hypothetical protein